MTLCSEIKRPLAGSFRLELSKFSQVVVRKIENQEPEDEAAKHGGDVVAAKICLIHPVHHVPDAPPDEDKAEYGCKAGCEVRNAVVFAADHIAAVYHGRRLNAGENWGILHPAPSADTHSGVAQW